MHDDPRNADLKFVTLTLGIFALVFLASAGGHATNNQWGEAAIMGSLAMLLLIATVVSAFHNRASLRKRLDE